MIKFLLACLAMICTIFGFALVGVALWLVASLLEALFLVIPASVGVIITGIVVFGWIGWMIWFAFKVCWIFAKSLYETFCETFIK